MKFVFAGCAAMSVLCVALICWFLFPNAIPAILKIGPAEFFFSADWAPEQNRFGILAMIAGSLCLALGAVVLGVPIGVLCAVFLVYYCPAKLYKPFSFAISLLAGIPSIVYGFFGLTVLVPLIQKCFGTVSGKGILCSSILLAMMILPTIVSLSESALRKTDPAIYDASRALGASHDRTVFYVCLPAAVSGIRSAVVLGIGRAIGETMAVIMVAGNAAIFPSSLLSPVRTLTTGIVLEMSYATGLHRQALIALGAVLFVIILVMNLYFSSRKRKEMC
ncbi:phosphate ABC transporter permease subunit PstC [Allobaculum mucilyticum]|uniref:phosphate ABC transporter permease subunit PstC n=1 Tax=Allobaculum mucilyticum TaxID=2834459 RepID=UPI001E3EAE40|nr:phosphate ABC transporter permease subunit PstC [Allobaculum mucilyticum]UNT97159.1 phosphate ABC transporter permease subunit PstC [Allobaculum mucilyticum]